MSAIRIFIDHAGITAWLIIIAAVILVVAAIERIYFLYFEYSVKAEQPLAAIRTAVLNREYAKALQICNTSPSCPELMVIKAGLMAVDHGREAMKSALGGAALEISHAVEKRISIIALIAAISTLLGLLGTISGLINTFAALAIADAAQKAQLLGGGISEAMYATGAGLGLGIAAMVVHSFCTSKGEEIVGNAQVTGYKLITWVEESERSGAAG